MSLTQTEYDFIMQQEKSFDDINTPIQLGPAPIQWCRQINSLSNKEKYLLDFYRGSFELTRYTINKRYRQSIILFRYDNQGRHTNPDGEHFIGAHIHLYKEGFNDKFAYPITDIEIEESDALEKVFEKLMYFCNVKVKPDIEIPMF